MRKINWIVILFAALIAGLQAKELKIETPKAAWQRAKKNLTGNTVPANFQKGPVAGEWSFWYVASGDTPETMKFMPFVPTKVVHPTTKKETLVFAPVASSKYNFPFINLEVSTIFLPAEKTSKKIIFGKGVAFAFKAAFAKPAKVFLEGQLRHIPGSRVTVVLKRKDGTFQPLTSTAKPGADEQITVTYGRPERRITRKLAYFRLQEEFTMAPDDMVFFIIDNAPMKRNQWTDVGYLADNIRRNAQPQLSAVID